MPISEQEDELWRKIQSCLSCIIQLKISISSGVESGKRLVALQKRTLKKARSRLLNSIIYLSFCPLRLRTRLKMNGSNRLAKKVDKAINSLLDDIDTISRDHESTVTKNIDESKVSNIQGMLEKMLKRIKIVEID